MPFTFPDQLRPHIAYSGQRCTRYIFEVPPKVTLAEVMHPDAFVHCRGYINTLDIFEIVAADGTYEADFRIVVVNKVTGAMKFRLLRYLEPEGAAVATATEKGARFEARWNPGFKKHQILERTTGQVVAEGFASLAEARAEADAMETERRAA